MFNLLAFNLDAMHRFKSLQCFFLIILGVIIMSSCAQREEGLNKKSLIQKDSIITMSDTRGQVSIPVDSTSSKYIDHKKPHPDSIKSWNVQVLDKKEKLKVKPISKTKMFSIDSNSGKVAGCPFIKFKGFIDNQYWKNQKEKNNKLRFTFEEVRPKIRSVIMEGKEELWYGDPVNGKSEETAHSGRGPTGFLYDDNGKYLIVSVGYPHGGMMDELFFFNRNGEFISKTILDRPLNMPYVEFNSEQTFVTVSDGVNGDFYFFKTDGSLERKGNFNEVTKDRGTSYGRAVISKTGKYWMLNNNIDYIFDSNENFQTKIVIGGSSFFIEDKDIIIYTYGSQISILNLSTNQLLYQSDYWAGDNIGYFNNSDLFFTINKKTYCYEVVL